MDKLLSVIKKTPGVLQLQGAADTQIAEAERELGLTFAAEYRLYLKEFGCIAFGGHEFTGLHTSKRLDVVCVTQFERKRKSTFAANMYVLEVVNDGDIIVVQDEAGAVFAVDESRDCKKTFDSFGEYIKALW